MNENRTLGECLNEFCELLFFKEGKANCADLDDRSFNDAERHKERGHGTGETVKASTAVCSEQRMPIGLMA